MTKVILLLIASITALSTLTGNPKPPPQDKSPQQASQTAAPPAASAIKVTITTIASSLGPPTDHYKVGDQIPVAITMTNNSSAPVSACVSSDLYQNLPKLTKDGKVIPYMQWQSDVRLAAQRDNTCRELNLPEPVLLMPNKPVMADWFVLMDSKTSSGAEAWYDTLPPGKYELMIQRRFSCCDGPMVESNKISFEIDQ
jgi:hypothetical protein